MRVLYAINSGVLGGAEKHIADLTHGLSAKGHSVHIWCEAGLIDELFKNTTAVVTHQKLHFDICLSYIFKLYNYLKRENIDVVHTHDLKAGVNALIAAKLAGVPVRVGHIHTPLSVWEISGVKKAINLFVYRLVHTTCATHEIAITNTARDIKLKEGLDPAKIVVIPNAVNIDTKYDPALVAQYLSQWGFTDTFVMGCVGRLSIEKNLSLLIKAFHKLALEHENIRLVLIGGGDEESKLKALINELNLEQKVVITGVFPDGHKAALFKTLNLFVFPSLTEGFGYVPLEALSLGLPVISSDIPVLKEVFQDSVVYFKSNDENDLCTKLKDFVTTNKGIDRAIVSKTVASYSMSAFISNYLSLYERKVL
ncbi:MAG: hypothetical protein RLY61_566 [Candidatus Parcubacteria bacterium]